MTSTKSSWLSTTCTCLNIVVLAGQQYFYHGLSTYTTLVDHSFLSWDCLSWFLDYYLHFGNSAKTCGSIGMVYFGCSSHSILHYQHLWPPGLEDSNSLAVIPIVKCNILPPACNTYHYTVSIWQ